MIHARLLAWAVAGMMRLAWGGMAASHGRAVPRAAWRV